MIGIHFSRRRREFLKFASENPLNYQEILDPTDTTILSQFSVIFTDDSAVFAESILVKDIGESNFDEIFGQYVMKHKISEVFTEDRFNSAVFYYYDKVHNNCSNVDIAPIVEVAATFVESETVLPIHSVTQESASQREPEIADVRDISEFVEQIPKADLSKEPLAEPNMHTSVFVEEPPPTPPPLSSEPLITSYSDREPIPDVVIETSGVQQPYNQQAYTQDYQQGYTQAQTYAMPTQVFQQPFSQGVSQRTQMPISTGVPTFPQMQQTLHGNRLMPQQTPYNNPSMPQQAFYGNQLMPQQSPCGNQLMPQQVQSPVLSTGGLHMRRRGSSTRRSIGVPVYTFSSLTDKAGTTTVAFLLAKTLANVNAGMRIVYVDLNISNPNTISNLLGYGGISDASILNISTAPEIDFAANISLLTDTVPAGDNVFSMITFGEATFRQKTSFTTIDYTQFLSILADSFDVVLVDIGKLQGTLAYQHLLLSSHSAKHILVADGSSTRSVNTFISATRGLTYNFEIVVNKSAPTIGTFIFNKSMHINPLAAIGYHNNTLRFITDSMQFEGTAMHNELITLGGAL